MTWDQVAKAYPVAIDAFGAPTWGLLVVMTNEELFVCQVTKDGLGRPLQRSALKPWEKVVMAQWSVGKFVTAWSDEFNIFKRNPGPHNEPPNN